MDLRIALINLMNFIKKNYYVMVQYVRHNFTHEAQFSYTFELQPHTKAANLTIFLPTLITSEKV